ncbi:hypothetical protein AVEN_241367-1 [Araneus ventricosus]|uniref:Uncharacterized protein n=1 Tax=Araneus ventricosus TaxID=182803 RepID=A0A4Y2QFU4_ARAVE|nr:hypothetical protein AVEN_175007-1 [Araneus ventricosus]GBN62401.1 hypothetical protein AVEN_241367-1 [Araneus ventricosus]
MRGGGGVILLGNTPLSAVHECQHNRLNNRTDVQICSQGAWDNHESAPAVIGNCSPDHESRSSVSRPQTGWLQALTWPPSNHTRSSLAPRQNRLSSENNRSPLRPPMSSSLTPLTSQTAVVWSRWNARYRASGAELCLK